MNTTIVVTVTSPGQRLFLVRKEFVEIDFADTYIARMKVIYGIHFQYGWR